MKEKESERKRTRLNQKTRKAKEGKRVKPNLNKNTHSPKNRREGKRKTKQSKQKKIQ